MIDTVHVLNDIGDVTRDACAYGLDDVQHPHPLTVVHADRLPRQPVLGGSAPRSRDRVVPFCPALYLTER